jgi:hypothetical protein
MKRNSMLLAAWKQRKKYKISEFVAMVIGCTQAGTSGEKWGPVGNNTRVIGNRGAIYQMADPVMPDRFSGCRERGITSWC